MRRMQEMETNRGAALDRDPGEKPQSSRKQAAVQRLCRLFEKEGTNIARPRAVQMYGLPREERSSSVRKKTH